MDLRGLMRPPDQGKESLVVQLLRHDGELPPKPHLPHPDPQVRAADLIWQGNVERDRQEARRQEQEARRQEEDKALAREFQVYLRAKIISLPDDDESGAYQRLRKAENKVVEMING